MALITVNVSAQGTNGFATPQDLTIDTGSIQYLLDGGKRSTLRVVYQNSTQDWQLTTDYSASVAIIYAADPLFMGLTPTSFNGAPLYYHNVFFPFSAINYFSGGQMVLSPNGAPQGTQCVFGTPGTTASAIYDIMISSGVNLDFSLISSATIVNAVATPSTTLLINRVNVQNLILTKAGVREWIYDFGNSTGKILGKETHTYTYTSPTFGAGDTMTTLTVQPLGSAPIAHAMGGLAIQSAPNKTAIANAIKAYITSLGETCTNVLVTGNTTSMVIQALGCTLPLNSVTLSIPNTTTFVVS